jgi:GNAT superfamily N-acetyltransferase
MNSSARDPALPLLTFPSDLEKDFVEHRRRCEIAADAVARQYGSAAAYRSRLAIQTIDAPDDPLLPAFYRLYAQVFTLADEREPLDGFTSVLAFNRDGAVQRDFGPFLEPVLLARDPGDGEIVAAVNFSLYAYPGRAYAFDASCQMHFLMVREDMRGLGIGGRLIGEAEKAIAEFTQIHCGVENPRAFITCEQNNPARMTHDEILADARAALIHPYARMDWWRRRGFKKLDFPYMQPPLSPDHAACEYLDYYARPSNATPETLSSIPCDVLIEHLRRFFFVSVGKLVVDMNANPQWRSVQAVLRKADSVALI